MHSQKGRNKKNINKGSQSFNDNHINKIDQPDMYAQRQTMKESMIFIGSGLFDFALKVNRQLNYCNPFSLLQSLL